MSRVSRNVRRYDPNKDRLALELLVCYGMNNSDFNYVTSLFLHAYTFHLGNRGGISPVVGVYFYNRKEEDTHRLVNNQTVGSLMFYTFGLAYHF